MSGKDVVDLKATCVCCGMEFAFKGPRTAHVVPKRCQHCGEHKLDGSAAERIAALEDHATSALRLARSAMDKARQFAKDKETALEDHKMSQYRSYQSHKRREWAEKMLSAVMAVHTDSESDSTCECGLLAPCPTVRAAEEFEREHPHPDYSSFVYEPPRDRPGHPLHRLRRRLGTEPRS
ncbi:hypothetical protein LK10_12280 [Sinomonas humi]|uniref:Uncharacterized protein n=2 Tax=Sinomonas humi TaxID=1338436 RepID=A0A0B2AKS5_9MICC|nr:hypothetical protein LK10_12280 [Sinomonas humi]